MKLPVEAELLDLAFTEGPPHRKHLRFGQHLVGQIPPAHSVVRGVDTRQ